MSNESQEERLKVISMTCALVASYVSHNHVDGRVLPSLIELIQSAIVQITNYKKRDPTDTVGKCTNPSEFKRSITPYAIISFIDGRPYKTLRRHLTQHGYTPDSYRQHFGLPADYPIVAASYSERRAEIARQFGFGRPAGRQPFAEIQTPTRTAKACRPARGGTYT